MDKLKEQLAVAKEHSFWILCGGILLFSLVSWWLSTGHLQKEQAKYKSAIDSAVSSVSAVASTKDHPNDSTNKGMDAVMQQFSEDVYAAWSRLAENQKQVLVWKGTFADEDFQKEVRGLQPIETKVTKEDITVPNRSLYREYIDDELPKLAEIIRSKWTVDAKALGSMAGGMPGMPGGDTGGAAGMPGMAGMAGMAGMGGMPGMGGGGGVPKNEDPSIVVSWNEGNQKEITAMHFGMATNDALPSTLQVLYAQEDLWVFQNLMQIIATTNAGATRKHEAAIKSIEYVRIGNSAGGTVGQITMAGNNVAGGGGMQGGGMGGGDASAMMAGGMAGGAGGAPGGMPGMPKGPGGAGGAPSGAPGAPGSTTTGPVAATKSVASGRYVDLSYAPIQDINRLKSAMLGSPTKPEDALLAVAKRMPVRMYFKMDYRKLSTLLAECGNSRLPVEVRQVRINRGTASSLGGGGGGGMMPGGSPGGMPGGMPGMGGGIMSGPAGTAGGAGMSAPGSQSGGGAGAQGMMGMMGQGMAGGGTTKPSSIASSKEDPNEIEVEIYGIVYIYNPPDRKLLDIPEPAGATPPGTVVPGPVTTPTSTTPTPPATTPTPSGG